MKTFLRLVLVVASSVLGVAAAVYLAGPPATRTVTRPAKLVAQAVAAPVELQLPVLSADRAPYRRLDLHLDEPPLPRETIVRSVPELKPVVAQVQSRVARQ